MDLRHSHVQDCWKCLLPGLLQFCPLPYSFDLWQTPCSCVLLERITTEESKVCSNLLRCGVAGQHPVLHQADVYPQRLCSQPEQRNILWWVPWGFIAWELTQAEGVWILPSDLSFLVISPCCHYLLLCQDCYHCHIIQARYQVQNSKVNFHHCAVVFCVLDSVQHCTADARQSFRVWGIKEMVLCSSRHSYLCLHLLLHQSHLLHICWEKVPELFQTDAGETFPEVKEVYFCQSAQQYQCVHQNYTKWYLGRQGLCFSRLCSTNSGFKSYEVMLWEFLETNVYLIARTYTLGSWVAEDVIGNSPILSFIYKYYWPRVREMFSYLNCSAWWFNDLQGLFMFGLLMYHCFWRPSPPQGSEVQNEFKIGQL